METYFNEWSKFEVRGEKMQLIFFFISIFSADNGTFIYIWISPLLYFSTKFFLLQTFENLSKFRISKNFTMYAGWPSNGQNCILVVKNFFSLNCFLLSIVYSIAKLYMHETIFLKGLLQFIWVFVCLRNHRPKYFLRTMFFVVFQIEDLKLNILNFFSNFFISFYSLHEVEKVQFKMLRKSSDLENN